jgi:DNA (cytosine-5)-methyltransferase 1
MEESGLRISDGKTFCEFFAGIGLVGEGLRDSGWRCVYANDISLEKRELYEARNGVSHHYHLEDIAKTEAVLRRIPDQPFFATASFPCIDLSLAGHYRGFGGEHSSTFFGFIEVVKRLDERRPRMILLENVSGFLTARGGADFESAVHALAELGYWLDAMIVDAKHFVPQSRPRVFVLAVDESVPRVDQGRCDLFGTPELAVYPNQWRPERLVQLMKRIEIKTGWLNLDLPSPPARTKRLLDCIDLDESQEWWTEGEVQRHLDMMSEMHRRRVDEILSSGKTWVGTIFRRIRKQRQMAEVRFDGLAGCLRTPTGGSAKQIVVAVSCRELRMRWMSPAEYARLQGADGFPLRGRRNQLLKGFADAVCVPAIRWIDEVVLTPFFESARLSPISA